jgi:hypothetical protein
MAPTKRSTPRRLLLGSVMWVVVSAFWLLFMFLKLQGLRSAGAYVSPFRYGAVVFYALVFAFWIVKASGHLSQMRADRAGKVS